MSDLFMKRSAQFGRGDELRWTLTREWNARLPRVCFIGHNPSTASHEIDDPTSQRWSHFARAWGYGGYVAVNLYPIRATDVREARRWIDWESRGPDWYSRDDIVQNMGVVAREAKSASLVVACWGAIAEDEIHVETVIEDIMDGEAPWPSIYVFGLTKAGAPIHPMARGKWRVPNDQAPIIWRENCNS